MIKKKKKMHEILKYMKRNRDFTCKKKVFGFQRIFVALA